MKNLPQNLTAAVDRARRAFIDRNVAQTLINCVDLTAVNRNVNPMLVNQICRDADQGINGKAASVTVHSSFLTQAFNNVARRRVPIATVVNYPDGTGTPLITERETRSAIIKGATEIEIVLDHKTLLGGDKAGARALLLACKKACGNDAKMKVVLESSAFPDHQTLYEAACLAIDCGADMLVTATDTPSMRATTTLEAAATMLQAIKDNRKGTGLKIGGEMDNVRALTPYVALARQMMGEKWIKPENFRVAGRALINEAVRIFNPPPQIGHSGI